jgi:hypothetical protein
MKKMDFEIAAKKGKWACGDYDGGSNGVGRLETLCKTLDKEPNDR